MQIVVPAAGRGSRFSVQGYSDPKPLLEVLGRPLVKWSTDGLRGIAGAKFIFLVLQEHIDRHQIDERLREMYDNCEVVSVQTITEGAASTVLLAKDWLNLNDDLAIVNCDNMFIVDLGSMKSSLSASVKGVIIYFASRSDRWSYVQVNEQGLAIRVAEKEVISDKATVGCYYFKQAKYFVEAAEYMIEKGIRTKGEFYVCPVYNILIEQGHQIMTFPCELHYSLGTPEEVEEFKRVFSSEPVVVR